MMDFLEMMNVLFDLDKKFNGNIRVEPHDGYLTVNIYVGIENTYMFKYAKTLFEPAE